MLIRYLALLVLAIPLSTFAQDLVLGDIPVPEGNPVTESKRVLGKILFWEEQLSTDNSVACGSCHKPAAGGSDERISIHPGPDQEFDTGNETLGSPGITLYGADQKQANHPNFGFARQVTRRASQSILTSMYADAMFWDGRSRDQLIDPITQEVILESNAALEAQALIPILSSIEMGHINRSWSQVTSKLSEAKPLELASEIPEDMANALQGGKDYAELFEEAFGDPAITPVRIAMAIATYERTLVPDQSPFDEYVRGNTSAMTADQIEGWELFQDSVCSHCHVPPLFTDNNFARTGLRSRFDDNGLQVFTKDTADFALFKIPSLRNVGLRSALTHVGWITDVQDAINFYNAGTQETGHTIFTDGLSTIPDPDNPGQSIRIDQIDFLGNEPAQQALVVDFLTNALTDPRAASETYPFDRPVLGSERRIAGVSTSNGSQAASDVSTTLVVNGALSLSDSLSSGDNISLNQSITVDPQDIGDAGELFVVILFNGQPYLRNSNGNFKAWNGNVNSLEPLAEKLSLSTTQLISVVENLKGLKGNFAIYSGYSTSNRLVYSKSPFRFSVE